MTQSVEPQSSRRTRWLIAAAAIGFATTVVVAGGRQEQTATADPSESSPITSRPSPLSDPDEFAEVGEAMTAKLCYTECHGWDEVYSVRRTVREWDMVVRDMAGRGVVGTRAQMALVREYLSWSFGLVAVNSAGADELAAVIGISKSDAEAIVAHREANGRFADIAALLEVPGIDKPTIEEQAYALHFD
jgi:competence ComEA-like helix-hairpin-helix protein